MQVGNWKKIADLGSGAFGIVSLWQNFETEECTAIKMCKFKTDSNLSPRQKERWNQEVDKLKIIDHPNIIKYKTIPEELKTYVSKLTIMPILPMEYCRKGNLRHVLLRPNNLSGLPEYEVRCILQDISNGLQYLHNLKITHRDVKPDNIVLQQCDDRKTQTIYKIIDLGYAKELGDSTVSFVGTLHYLAPEIFQGVNYNNSVDYWSMGILTFEIICGILPFVTHLTPFERFALIEKKKPDDICIYMSYSGQITYSSNIRKESFLSTCLKQDIEIWLKHVLTYNLEIRSQNFPNDIKPLKYLQNILKKKIIDVFSVPKLEFYSYEVTEGTLVSTLKDWISRDTKIPKTELLLFISENSFNIKDTDELLNVVTENCLYIARKHFVTDKINYTFPKLIKEVMKSAVKFNMQYFKGLKSQFIFFISHEKHIANNFRASFHMYLNFLNHLLKNVKNFENDTSSKINQLLTKIDCYNKMKVDFANVNVKNNKDYEDCVNCTQRLLASIERSIQHSARLKNKIKCVSNRLKVLSSTTSEIIDIVQNYNLETLYQQALSLIEKSDTNNMNKQHQLITNLTKLTSDIIRIKENVIKNKKLQAFSKVIGNIICYCFNLLDWIENFNKHIEDILKSFEQNKVAHFDILLKAAKTPKENKLESVSSDKMSLSNSINQELLLTSIPDLIQENQDLRYEFEDTLSSSIFLHKNSVDTLRLF